MKQIGALVTPTSKSFPINRRLVWDLFNLAAQTTYWSLVIEAAGNPQHKRALRR